MSRHPDQLLAGQLPAPPLLQCAKRRRRGNQSGWKVIEQENR